MVSFIDEHRDQYGVAAICTQVQIAASMYYGHKAREVNSERLPPRVRRYPGLSDEIQRVWDENYQV